MQDKCIATIEKSKFEELRIIIKECKGRRYVDVRTFVEPYADEGQGRIPTKKGITCPLDKLPHLIKALLKAKDEIEAKGLLKDAA